MKITCYNVHGLSEIIAYDNTAKLDAIRETIHDNDVTFLSETWLMKKQEPRINTLIGNDYGYFATSSIPTDFLEHGRGYGGTCIIYRSILKCTEIASNSVHFTAGAASLCCDNGDILLVSVYLPCFYNQQ